MKPKTVMATITLAVLPFIAIAAAEHTDHSSQAAVEQSTTSGTMAGHTMDHCTNVIDQVRNDLAALANENDPAVLHKRLAQDRTLLDQIHAHTSQAMQGMSASMMSGQSMMSGGMMAGHMSNCPGSGQQPQK